MPWGSGGGRGPWGWGGGRGPWGWGGRTAMIGCWVGGGGAADGWAAVDNGGGMYIVHW